MTELDRAIQCFPLISWLSRFVKVRDSSGDNLRLDCPFCKGAKTFGIHRVKKLAQCFRCQTGIASQWSGATNLVGLVQLFERVDRRAAVGIIFREARQSGFVADHAKAVAEPQQDLGKLPDAAIPLAKAHPTHAAVQMMRRRGVEHLIPVTSICVDGPYSGRVVLPCQFFGELHGWEAKSYSRQTPKSLFPQWMDTARVVYTTQQWDKCADFAILTESVLDAETFGINAVGLYGSTLRDGQVQRLLEMRNAGITHLVWCLDGDAWKKQAVAILRKTSLLFRNSILALPNSQDPNSLGREECWRLLQQSRPADDVSGYLFENLRPTY